MTATLVPQKICSFDMEHASHYETVQGVRTWCPGAWWAD